MSIFSKHTQQVLGCSNWRHPSKKKAAVRAGRRVGLLLLLVLRRRRQRRLPRPPGWGRRLQPRGRLLLLLHGWRRGWLWRPLWQQLLLLGVPQLLWLLLLWVQVDGLGLWLQHLLWLKLWHAAGQNKLSGGQLLCTSECSWQQHMLLHVSRQQHLLLLHGWQQHLLLLLGLLLHVGWQQHLLQLQRRHLYLLLVHAWWAACCLPQHYPVGTVALLGGPCVSNASACCAEVQDMQAQAPSLWHPAADLHPAVCSRRGSEQQRLWIDSCTDRRLLLHACPAQLLPCYQNSIAAAAVAVAAVADIRRCLEAVLVGVLGEGHSKRGPG
jgi:hypothetical protein